MAGGPPVQFNVNNRSPLFHISVDRLFNNWAALQLAVEHGQGGRLGQEIAIWMRGAVEEFFYLNDDLMRDEVAEFLERILEQELNTVVDDGSLELISESLCEHFRLALTHQNAKLDELHAALAAAAARARPAAQAASVQNGDDDSDDDAASDEEMDTEDSPSNNKTENATSEPSSSSHRAGHNFVTEPDDDGWVTVVKPKKH